MSYLYSNEINSLPSDSSPFEDLNEILDYHQFKQESVNEQQCLNIFFDLGITSYSTMAESGQSRRDVVDERFMIDNIANNENMICNYYKEKTEEEQVLIKQEIDQLELVVPFQQIEDMNQIEQHFEKSNLDTVTVSESSIFYENSKSSNIFDRYEEEQEALSKKVIKYELSERKLAADSLRKKIKIRIEEAVTNLVNQHYSKLLPQKMRFKKLPQNYLKDISIATNKQSLDMTLEERYCHDYMDKSKKKLKNNVAVIEYLKRVKDVNENPNSILKKTVRDIIDGYLKSKAYRKDLEKIEQSEGKDYAKEFDRYARGGIKEKIEIMGYLHYFTFMPANIRHKKNKE